MKSPLPETNSIAIIKNLNVSFKNGNRLVQVLHDVSFEVCKNEMLAIVGESGSGKSVTSKTLMGLLPAQKTLIQAEQLSFLNHDLRNLKESGWNRFRGSEMSMIFQEPMSSLNPTTTCGVQVAEVLSIHTNRSKTQIKNEVLSLFHKVKLPDPEITYQKYPHEISGGQMQRVMIAMAIACKPKLLIADEPTTALDVTVQKQIIDLIKELQLEYGMSVIFISHDLSLVKDIADRVIVMYQGKIAEQGTNTAVFKHPENDYTKALLASRPDPSQRLKRLPTVADFLEHKEKSQVITTEERAQRLKKLYDQEPLLEVKELSKDYFITTSLFKPKKQIHAVDHVSFQLFPGESLGLVGESGCGKSTLGSLILRLNPVSSGSIIYKGNDITSLKGAELRTLRKEIQIIFQDPFASLNPRIPIGQAISEPMKYHGIGVSTAERKQLVEELLERVGLEKSSYNRYPHEFSGGQRQRIGIARTISLRPQLIVCDESVSALDISVQAQVLNLLNELKEDFGFSYLFISHDLAVVQYFCDSILVMNAGEIEERNEADALYKHPKSPYTKKLIAAIPGNWEETDPPSTT